MLSVSKNNNSVHIFMVQCIIKIHNNDCLIQYSCQYIVYIQWNLVEKLCSLSFGMVS